MIILGIQGLVVQRGVLAITTASGINNMTDSNSKNIQKTFYLQKSWQ